MPLGVPSSFQAGDPYPIYLDRGQGCQVWDVDANQYTDFHGGFGVGVDRPRPPQDRRGHHPAAQPGTHFAAPTPVTVALAEELCRRFELDQVRFANSGTEATMDAIRVARAATGRDTVVKIEGSYHGHHDAVMFSVLPNADVVGGRDLPATTPMSTGIPADVAKHTARGAVQRRGRVRGAAGRARREIACLILEPVMMNIGIVEPEPGYLQAAQGPVRPPRRRAHLRRGEVRRHRRRGRCRRALRRAPAPGLLRQGAVRRHARARPSAATPPSWT